MLNRQTAAKYREYSKLRAAPPSKTNSRTRLSTSSSTAVKTSEKPPDKPPDAPAAPAAAVQTPRKNTANSPWGAGADEVYESPLSTARRRQRIFGRRDQVGPTPQRSGRVLGLFDSFGASDIMGSPTPLTGPGTPSKTSASPSAAAAAKGHGSPSSTTTPRKRKLAELAGSRGAVTDPGLPDPFATPMALRQWRPWQPPTGGRTEADSSPPVRRPPPMPKRGLSSLLRELREMEEHAFDDDEAALRDVEMESESAVAATGKSDEARKEPPPPPPPPPPPGLELPPLPPGAFVEDAIVDEDDGQAGRGAPRPWKKKGLKRQHRRVISAFAPTHLYAIVCMLTIVAVRPVVAKPSAGGAAPEPDGAKDEDEESVPSDIGDGQDASESGSDYDGAPKPKSSKRREDAAASDKGGGKKEREKEKEKEKKGGVEEKGQEVVKKAARKIPANAHSRMNFRKLNIKNRGGKGGGGGRFGGRGRRR